MPSKDHPVQIFHQYLPAQAVQYCFELWKKFDFYLNIKQKRSTKLGDYRYDPRDKSHTITVNADLNPYSFLVTYLHEVAHLVTQITYGHKADPHGQEWKDEFKKIAIPMVIPNVFPAQIIIALQRYFKNPKASSCSDPVLMKALHDHDENSQGTMLGEITTGKTFEFSGRVFLKETVQRTRVLCKEVSTGRKYLISKAALVTTKRE
jgi:SprT protein